MSLATGSRGQPTSLAPELRQLVEERGAPDCGEVLGNVLERGVLGESVWNGESVSGERCTDQRKVSAEAIGDAGR